MKRATALMVLFLALFYSYWGLSHLSRHAEERAGAVLREDSTREELRAREEKFQEIVRAEPARFAAVAFALFFAVTAGLVVDGVLVLRQARGQPFLRSQARHHRQPWGTSDVTMVFVLLFFLEAVFVAVESLLYHAAGEPEINKDFILMVNSLVRDVVVVGLLLFLVAKKYGRPLSEIGLSCRHFFSHVRTGIWGYLAVIPPLVALLIALSLVAKVFSYEPPPQPVVEIYIREKTSGVLVFFTVFVAVLGPIMEEIFFRGFAYKAFRSRFGVTRGTLLVAGIFSLLHMSLVAFIPIFFLGIFLTYLYEKTGSLVPGMTAHMIHNLIMVGFTLGFKALTT